MPRGLLEVASGWALGVGWFRDRVVLVEQYDPAGRLPRHGVKEIRLTAVEAAELSEMLAAAAAQTRGHQR